MTPRAIVRNVLAGITTSLAMVPEVVAFALLAKVNPVVGLYAAVILGFVTAAFGGRPGLISGGAGSLAVVSVALVVNHGVDYLFACIILMGVFQFAFGLCRLGRLIRYVTPAVMNGFVNGLVLLDLAPSERVTRALLGKLNKNRAHFKRSRERHMARIEAIAATEPAVAAALKPARKKAPKAR